MGPSANGGGISIPTTDAPMSAPGDEQGWANGARSPGRTQGDHPPRRSSRSRSPGVRDAERGYVQSINPHTAYSQFLAAAMEAGAEAEAEATILATTFTCRG